MPIASVSINKKLQDLLSSVRLEDVDAFLDAMDQASRGTPYGGPVSLGVVPAAKKLSRLKWKQLAKKIPQVKDKLMELINARNRYYHATSPGRAKSILKDKTILSSEPGVGVSLSRVPGIPTFSEQGAIFSIDPTKIPKHTPIAESGYGKFNMFSDINPQFEFETRTSGPIDISAIKEILLLENMVDPSLLETARQKNIPVTILNSLKKLQTYRAGMSTLR